MQRSVPIGHKAVRSDPDDGICAVPDCGRKLEALASPPKHKRGGIRGAQLQPRLRTTGPDDPVRGMSTRLENLEKTAYEQKKLIGSLKNELKQLLKRVQTLESGSKEPKISHRRIVDGGIHAKQQQKRPRGTRNDRNGTGEIKILQVG